MADMVKASCNIHKSIERVSTNSSQPIFENDKISSIRRMVSNNRQPSMVFGIFRSVLIALLFVTGTYACSTGRGSITANDPMSAETAYISGDYATALRKWRTRAENGDADAQYGLAYMYRNGQGVPQDSKEAGIWYEKAAAQGHVKAQVKLGLMYAKGDGFPQNSIQAHKWFNLAAAQGLMDAARARDKIAQNMSPAEIEKAIELSQRWKAGH